MSTSTEQASGAPRYIKYKFLAGNLALDFCNTVAGDRGEVAREYLDEPFRYISWAQQAGLLSEEEAARCLRRAALNPEEGGDVLARAVRLREAIFRLATACSSGDQPRNEDLLLLNDELAQALHRLSLVRSTNSKGEPASACDFRWEWRVTSDSLDEPLGPIAHAAATLLTQSDQVAHIRMCHGNDCGWLFIDHSKNHSRCWCDMRDCGNLAKIRRHRQKQRGRTGGSLVPDVPA